MADMILFVLIKPICDNQFPYKQGHFGVYQNHLKPVCDGL